MSVVKDHLTILYIVFIPVNPDIFFSYILMLLRV